MRWVLPVGEHGGGVESALAVFGLVMGGCFTFLLLLGLLG
jgi:hypothetical protein